MSTNEKTATVLVDSKIDVKTKLAILWVALVLCYAYADIISFFQPGIVEELQTGEIAGIEMSQGFLLSMSILMTVPILMAVLSLLLKAKVNRTTNIIVSIFHAFVLVTTMLVPGDTWAYYAYFMTVEALLIGLIVWHAWKWPEIEGTAEMRMP